MRIRFTLLSLASALLALTTLTSADSIGNDDCWADGETSNLCWTINLQGNGDPVGLEIVPGTVTGLDYDWGTDDELGGGTLTGGNRVCVPITNNGGVLSGPNGTAQSGGSEGCLEVYITYMVRWEVTVCTGTINGGGSIGVASVGATTGTTCHQEYRTETRTTGTHEVCACD